MIKSALSILVAFLGFSVMNISQASQKIGLEMLPKKKGLGGFIWTLGLIGASAATFILFYAVAIGSVSLVGAMAGTGLASLTLFSIFVMKEKVGGREILGVAVILVAAVLIGAFSKGGADSTVNLKASFIFMGATFLLYIILWIALAKKTQILGIVIGSFGGATGGLIPMFQKISASDVGQSRAFFDMAAYQGSPAMKSILGAIANPYSIVWVCISLASIIILQFAYKKDKAIRIIPAYSATNIVLPLISGMLCFSERLNWIQWIGVAAILAGVFLITAKPKTAETDSGTGA